MRMKSCQVFVTVFVLSHQKFFAWKKPAPKRSRLYFYVSDLRSRSCVLLLNVKLDTLSEGHFTGLAPEECRCLSTHVLFPGIGAGLITIL